MAISPKQVIVGIIGLIVGLIAGLGTVETVVDQVSGINTTGWDFTGYEGAEAILGLIPFGYVAGLALFGVVGSIALFSNASD
jgi:hypothetical protein